LGFSHFDTSPYYGFGLAEIDLGEALHARASSTTISSKVGLYPPQHSRPTISRVWLRKLAGRLIRPLSRATVNWSVERASSSLDSSLRRLRRVHLDILFLHEPRADLMNTDEVLRWLERERAAGRVRFWGLAGEPCLVRPLVAQGHPLAQVIQVRDSLEPSEADDILRSGRQIDFCYGYVASAMKLPTKMPISEIFRRAFAKKPNGSILISTRRVERVGELAAYAAAINGTG
jgi:aryl-alcohol dehydrogenase-like predicted oxidoreductase